MKVWIQLNKSDFKNYPYLSSNENKKQKKQYQSFSQMPSFIGVLERTGLVNIFAKQNLMHAHEICQTKTR